MSTTPHLSPGHPPLDQLDLASLAERAVEHGPAAVHAELCTVAALARLTGASDVLAAIVEDGDQPDVARLRAFGRLAHHLASGTVPVVADRPLALAS